MSWTALIPSARRCYRAMYLHVDMMYTYKDNPTTQMRTGTMSFSLANSLSTRTIEYHSRLKSVYSRVEFFSFVMLSFRCWDDVTVELSLTWSTWKVHPQRLNVRHFSSDHLVEPCTHHFTALYLLQPVHHLGITWGPCLTTSFNIKNIGTEHTHDSLLKG